MSELGMKRNYVVNIAPPMHSAPDMRINASKYEITNTTVQQLVLCSDKMFFSFSSSKKLFIHKAVRWRSPLFASTRLHIGYVQSWGRKRLACWMRKRKIDESSFGSCARIHFT